MGIRGRAFGLVVAIALVWAGPASARTPIPHVTGPLPVSAASYPFGAADHQLVPQDLRRHGYVEEEYLVSGTANVYNWPRTGSASVRTPNAPYTTRMLVRRPANRRRMSGNVIVEPLNPSNLFDLNIGWALMHDQFMRHGDVWVGFTAKPVDVAALKTFDPARYGSLSFANPLALSDPANCATPNTPLVPTQLLSRDTEDGLIWDIFSQIGTWARSDARSNPLARHVAHAYGFGYSQTGGYMVDYLNAINPLVVASDGRGVYDGYIVGVAGGNFIGAVPINQCSDTPRVSAGVVDPRLVIRNAGVPVIKIMSQSDYLAALPVRREDSDSKADPYRHYEMAGAAHATPDELYFSAAPADIVKAGRDVPPGSCNEGPRSRFPSSIHFDAALTNLDLWVRYHLPPPHADPITVVNNAPVLDAFGNVTGGLRSPFVDVPTSTWFASSTGASFCGIAGHEVPLPQATLDALYPTHGAYVRAVTRDVGRLVGDRLLTPHDGIELIIDAARADVP
jgi:alpha/beta hydrolase family protein